MIEAQEVLNIQSGIVSLYRCTNGVLGLVSGDKRLYLVETDRWHIRQRYEFSRLGTHPKHSALSYDARYFAYADAHELFVLDLHNAPAVEVIDLGTQHATDIAFDVSGKYLIVGTDEGRVWIWRSSEKEVLTRLTSFPEHSHNMLLPLHNYVSAIKGYRHWCASAGYGDSIVISDLSTMRQFKRVHSGRSRINVLEFLDEHAVLAGNEEGKLVKLFIREHQPHTLASPGVGAIAHIVLLREHGFALAASSHNHIALIETDTMQTLDSGYIQIAENISAMIMDEANILLVATHSGVLYRVELMVVGLLKQYVDDEAYALAYALVESNALLKKSDAYAELERRFYTYYAETLKYLLAGKENEARKAIEIFVKIGTKKRMIDDLFYAFAHYSRLQFLVGQKKYAVAYDLIQSYKPLQKTPEYKAMEAEWEMRFERAQKLLVKGDNSASKAMLKPFANVVQKAPLVQLLLQLSNRVIAFSHALQTHDFQTLHTFIQEYPQLRTMPSYQKLIASCDSLIETIMNALKADRFDEAFSASEMLMEVPHLKKHYAHIEHFIQKAQQLQHAHIAQQWRQCYGILDSMIELSVLPRSKVLETKWQQTMSRCEERAYAGDAKAVLEKFMPLLPLSSRQERMGTILRVAYRVQLRHLDNGAPEYVVGIKQYLELFGTDSEIRGLMRNRGEEVVAPEPKSRDHWLNHYRRLPDFIYKIGYNHRDTDAEEK